MTPNPGGPSTSMGRRNSNAGRGGGRGSGAHAVTCAARVACAGAKWEAVRGAAGGAGGAGCAGRMTPNPGGSSILHWSEELDPGRGGLEGRGSRAVACVACGGLGTRVLSAVLEGLRDARAERAGAGGARREAVHVGRPSRARAV